MRSIGGARLCLSDAVATSCLRAEMKGPYGDSCEVVVCFKLR